MRDRSKFVWQPSASRNGSTLVAIVCSSIAIGFSACGGTASDGAGGTPTGDAGGGSEASMDAGRDASVEPSDAPSGGDAVADAGAMGSGSVSGTIGANAWPSVMSALWIGNPQSNPTEIFLFDAPVACASITSPNWDKPLGNTQILELGVNGTTARTYAVPAEADVNYLRAQANPTADSGSVTVASITPTTKIVGTFTAKFGADTLTGSFEAIYCAAGVEP